jgi:hypothetical protein
MTALLLIVAALWIVRDIATISDHYWTEENDSEETYHGTLF